MKTEFYYCEICKSIVTNLNGVDTPKICCGEPMKKLVAGSVEASQEKHIPVCEMTSNQLKVSVGSILHPMEEKHYIEWILIKTDKGEHVKYLEPNKEPVVTFSVKDEKVQEVYAYCNLHGLWKVEL